MPCLQGHEGFPNDRIFLSGNSLNATVWDADTGLMTEPGCDDLGTEAVEKTGDNQYKIRLPFARDNLQVGNVITVSQACSMCLDA
jgi:hypothetical protein